MATLRNHPGYWLRDDAAAAFDRAEADHGIFVVNSAGRTVAEQQDLINRWDRGGAANRPPYLYEPARPAETSNHVRNGGVAIDLGDWRRFAAVCRDYGFQHTYPSGDPVHFDFVGGGSPSRDDGTLHRQAWLNSRGWDLVVDGIEGPLTTQAYKEYQSYLKDRGWYSGEIDGVWGPQTQAAHEIYYAEVNPAPQASNPFGIPYCAGLQKVANLYLDSRNKTPIDQVWGPKSAAGFAQFLRQNYGYSGNDELGPVMWAAIARWLRARWGYVGNDTPGPVMREALQRAEEANYREL